MRPLSHHEGRCISRVLPRGGLFLFLFLFFFLSFFSWLGQDPDCAWRLLAFTFPSSSFLLWTGLTPEQAVRHCVFGQRAMAFYGFMRNKGAQRGRCYEDEVCFDHRRGQREIRLDA